MSERQWYYIQGGAQAGPIPESQLKSLLQSGTVGPETMVWSDNLAGWTPAGQIPALGSSGDQPQWHYLEGNQQVGPVPQAEVKRLLGTGRLSPQTLVWTAGMANWVPLSTVAALAAPESQAAAATQPAPATASAPAASDAALTPSEVVLLFADQFVGEGTVLKGGNWTTLTTGAKVGYMELTATLLTAALLANEQAGAIRLRMQPKKAMLGLKSVNVVMVDYLQDPPTTWPASTFEWLAVEGMRGQQSREAADLFTGMLLTNSTYPHTLASMIVSVGLADRGVLLTEEKKKLLIIKATNFTVTDQTRAAMAACPPGPVRQWIDQLRQTRPDIYQGLADAAKAAISNRTEYND